MMKIEIKIIPHTYIEIKDDLIFLSQLLDKLSIIDCFLCLTAQKGKYNAEVCSYHIINLHILKNYYV